MANTALQTLTTNPLLQKIMQVAPTWLNVVLVLILGYWAADFAWMMVPVKESPKAPPAQVTSSGVTQQKVFYGAKVANKHLFGQVDAAPVAKIQEDLKETRLDLVLRGVFAHNPQDKALAMISRGNGRQEVYAVGDSLPGNAELVEIHSDKVIIEYQGRYETLTLEQIKGVALQTTSTPAPVRRTPSSSNPGTIRPARANQLRQEFLANPSKLMSMVNIKQQRSGGQLLGYQVDPKGDPSLFYELGLQEGDVLISVNGLPLSNTQALGSLRNADRYDVVVMRRGAEVPLSISFR